ncbi:hypothetical protein Tco_0519963 [Tanacetum coccineum]
MRGTIAVMAIADNEPDLGKTDARSDEVSDLKKIIKKWTSSKVTLDQLLTEQVPDNIVCALGRRGKKKDTTSSKDVVFIKVDNSPFENSPEYTFDAEFVNDNQDPLPLLPKLSVVEPIGTLKDVITTNDLTRISTHFALKDFAKVKNLGRIVNDK